MKRLLLLLPVLLPILHGCAMNCTEMGCTGALNVFLQGAPADGEWSVEVDLDDQVAVCKVTLPGGEPICASPLSLTVEDLGMTLVWQLPMGESGVGGRVLVSRDGLLLVDQPFTADWSEPFYPNGKVCDDGMGCSSADVKFSIQ